MLTAGFVLLEASPVEPATFEVRQPGDIGTLGDVYTSIQQAIDYAADGDTIYIHDGTYTETLTITGKGLTIIGDNENSVIIQASETGPVAGNNVFTINADGKDITLQNLTIRNGDYGIRSSAGNVNVLHCTFYHNGWDGTPYPDPPTQQGAADMWASEHTTNGGAIRIENSAGSEIAYCTVYENARAIRYQDGDNGNIHHNVVYDNIESGIYLAASTYDGASGCTNTDVNDNQSYNNMNNGILCIGGRNNTIRNNDIHDNWNSGVALWHVAETTVQGNTINHNNLYSFNGVGKPGDAYGGVYAVGSTNVAGDAAFVFKLLGNTISNNQAGAAAQATGIRLDESLPGNGIEITGNTLANHDVDIHVRSQAATTSVHQNVFDGTGIGVQNDDTSATLDAESNYWGDASGPYNASTNPDGQGDEVSDYVDFMPWYTAESMGMPVVVKIGATEDIRAYAETIQEGIAVARSGDTIEVSEGTYEEIGQIVIDKNLTIKGVGSSKPIIKPDRDTGDTDDARGWWLVNDGVVLNLENLVLDGSGFKIYQAIRTKGGGTVNKVDFKNITYNESGPHYSGLAMAVFGNSPVDVNGCTFENIGRIGVLYFGPGVAGSVFSNNTYTGKGPGDWLDYGVELGAGAVVEVIGNTITDCNGIASVDGSTSAGILVTTYYGGGTEATISNNILIRNSAGIAVGYDESDTSIATIRCNSIAGNYEYGITVSGPDTTTDARYNWWGSADGPGGEGPGSGDAVSEYVDYFPWLFSTDCNDSVVVQADFVVDDDWAGLPMYTQVLVDSTAYYIGLNAFDTIQGAVDAATDGNSIKVLDGSYAGAVVNKELHITGVDGNSVVITSGVPYKDGSGLKTAFRLDSEADGTELSNFVINCSMGDNFYFGVFARGANNVVVDSLTVNKPVQGITNWGGSNWKITNNALHETGAAGGGGIAIMVGARPPDYCVASGNLIQGNVITPMATALTYTCPAIAVSLDLRYGGYEAMTGAEDVSYNQVLDNDIAGNGLGSEVGVEIGVIGVSDDPNKIAATLGLVHDNLVRGNIIETVDWGVYFYTVADLDVQANEIIDCNEAVHIEDSHVGVGVNFNVITGSSSYGVNNTGGVPVDATYNWWGHVSGPNDPAGTAETDGSSCYNVSITKNANGLGDGVTDEDVQYCPWLLAPIMATNSPCPPGDLDGDCDVDFDDFAVLAENWLQGVTP